MVSTFKSNKLGMLLLFTAVFFAVGTSQYSVVYAQPKMVISANRSPSSSAGITVNKNELVNIKVSAEEGSIIAVFCVPKLSYISPPDQKEVTFYASQSVIFMFACFKDGQVSKQEYLVTVGDSPVPTPPGPPTPPIPVPPGPVPNPTIPTSPIGKAIYNEAIKVNSPTRNDDIKILVGGLNAIKSKAVATSSYTYEQILVDCFKPFKDIKPDTSKSAWKAFVLTMLTTYKTNGVSDKDKMVSAISDTIDGLNAAVTSGSKKAPSKKGVKK